MLKNMHEGADGKSTDIFEMSNQKKSLFNPAIDWSY